MERLKKIPDGKILICLNVVFDNSDPMTDYFDRHALVESFILAIVPQETKRTEKLVRSIVVKYPDLARVEFTWHKENWSMGNGYYLESGVIGTRTVRGKENIPCRYEIVFNSFVGAKDGLEFFPGYSGQDQEVFVKQDSSGVTIGKYKGHPTITLPCNGQGFTFGLLKARAILEFKQEIEDFVNQNS